MTAPWQRSWLKSKNNPLMFVRDVLGATPESWQAEALEAVGRHDRVSIRSGHGVWKTTFESWLILWFLLTRQNCKIPVAANSQDQLRDTIWPEIAKWHRQLPEPLKAMIDVQAERIVVVHDPEGAFAVRRTASKDNEGPRDSVERVVQKLASGSMRDCVGVHELLIGRPLLLELLQGVPVGHSLLGRKLADEDVDHSMPMKELVVSSVCRRVQLSNSNTGSKCG